VISDASGTPRCRGKFIGSGTTTWRWARYGYFQRDIIQASTASYTRSTARSDCVGAPTCTYTEEIQNYARWWAYYRTRMQMMKTASGRAFLPFISNPSATPSIPDKIRVGFITINPFYNNSYSSSNQGSVQASRYLRFDSFNTTHASSWYTKFYAQIPDQGTPLREALSRAGWMYAGKLNVNNTLTEGIPVTDDPVLQSCQRHFSLLTTDGYWNGNSGQDLIGGAIGNLDNGNPLTDSPYASPSVDRTTTGTFDGGKGTVISTSTPTNTLEQVVCYANNATAFSTGGAGSQSTCGCAAGEHRIKQRTSTTADVISTTDGVPTGSTSTSGYTFQDITGCSPSLVVNNQTPANRIQQNLCTGSATISWGQGTNTACGCATSYHKRVWQQQGDRTHTVITTDGSVTTDSYNSYTYTTTPITACDAQVSTTTQISTHTHQVLCQGGATTNFASPGGAWPDTEVACGCSGVFKAIRQRVVTRTTTNTTIDGVVQPVNVGYVNDFTTPTACNALVATSTRTPVNITQTILCTGNQTVSFADGTTASCNCNSGRKMLIRETYTGATLVTAVTHDGAGQPLPVPAATGGTRVLAYSVNNGGSFQGTPFSGGSCGSSGSTQNPVGQNITGPVATTAFTGATVTVANITQVPNPQTVNNATGAPVVVGNTISTANFTLPVGQNPQINDPAGATVTTTTGTAIAVAISPNPSNPTVGTPTTTTTLGGYPDTLADVAMYYFRADLRGGVDTRGGTTGPALNLGGTGTVDVSANNVPARAGSKDFATHQHMVTFTVGLVDGLMRYQPDYETSSSGDFAAIKAGTSNGCFWISGTCDWPQPFADNASALDDLWHAAVNGRGQYYLANNADLLATGIQTALTAVNAQVAAAAASATSSPNVTQTDNQIFSTTYETNTWSGKVFAQTIDPATGNVNPTIQWHADGQLLSKVAASTDTRTIWTFDGAATDKLKPFLWASLSGTEQAFFLGKCVPASTMTQCTSLTIAQLVTANDGTSLVGYLRGQLGNEVTVFRDRTYIDIANNNAVVQTVLGDTISAKPAYLRKPQFNYADAVTPTYSSFLSTNNTRSPRVYVAANDGYLHAFHGDTGEEMWAYLPRFLMPALYQLADTGYASLHRYYADGSPETGDVYDSGAGAWKTILVAGVAGGGRGFYALDVTDPSNPKGLWEFCSDASLCAIADGDLGLSYGNPVIGKRALDGKWVVLLTSGLNNTGTGTGLGYFYVLDALTGAVLHKVSTGAGSLTTPSGLMKVSAFYDSAFTDGTFRYAYAGDQLGNVWRIDTRTDPPTVLHIATLTDGSTPARGQPITTRPSLTKISGNRVMYFGTGRYLGAPDVSDPGAGSGISWQQTLWAFKDKDSDYTNLRTAGNLVAQTLTQITPTTRGISTNPVDWNTKDGWFVDFNPSFAGVPNSPGEGVNLVDPRLVLGTLVITTNVPASGGSSCSVGGSSFEYNFDFKTGQAVSTSAGGVVGRSLGGTITVGVAIVQLPSGAIKSISTGADTSKTTTSVNTSSSGAAVRRFSYRVR
jgi:Tfp pilus tip-associated adhesin PilY1